MNSGGIPRPLAKQQRKARDLTQEALAEQVGCSWETIRNIEAGTQAIATTWPNCWPPPWTYPLRSVWPSYNWPGGAYPPLDYGLAAPYGGPRPWPAAPPRRPR